MLFRKRICEFMRMTIMIGLDNTQETGRTYKMTVYGFHEPLANDFWSIYTLYVVFGYLQLYSD